MINFMRIVLYEVVNAITYVTINKGKNTTKKIESET